MKITDDMLTEWFPAAEYDPAHPGTYQTRTWLHPEPEQVLFELGEWWKFTAEGEKFVSAFPVFRDAEWRGLKEKHHG
ncbi:Uncharacterised protein [Burkholderia pseudomallei]|uniref:hypothetical protein n=1 Tax=Burkholderia pseudomallei TaxID=28450 RepID=UPI00235ECEF6|nr:hypothetical protein [Burkholderia pseudomallei]CAJ8845859.1 Uncharacterised protein [Burkholderia pseudomallei]CAJ9913807.1 Uncharacterised protein [Burkholderia pseudomallei]